MSPDFDQRLADWLEEDPDRAPAATLSTVLAAFPSIPQRRAARVPWRFPAMPRFALLGAAAAMIVAVGLTGLVLSTRHDDSVVGAPTPAPSPAAVSSLDATFTSPFSGYTIRYPSGWSATPASAQWAPGTETMWGNPALDVLRGPDARLVAASQPLTAGQTPQQWYQAYCGLGTGTPGCADAPASWAPIAIGDASGYVDIDGTHALQPSIGQGLPMYDASVVVGGRGYEFTLDGHVTRALFEQLLASVAFTAAPSLAPSQPSAVLDSTYSSHRYGYTIPINSAWTVTPATKSWAGPDNSGPVVDTITATGTNSQFTAAAQRRKGQTWVTFLNSYYQAGIGPAGAGGCYGGPPSTWEPFTIGAQSGLWRQMCDAADVLVEVGGWDYAFTWSNTSFDLSKHLSVADVQRVLAGVTFDGPPSP
jgi:hypothetical protein